MEGAVTVKLLEGDCREVLKTLPSDSVHCVVTSPPYFGLRSYGIGTENGEIGLDAKAAGNDDRTFRDKPFSTVGNGYKPKDLLMMPARLALALQADGWWIRSDIIWSKPNPMPESVTDRPTSAHEHVFLITKSARYYYDADAVREESITNDPRRPYTSEGAKQLDGRAEWKSGQKRDGDDFSSRNLRNVWTIATHAYPEAHFATFPPKLAERCIKAGTSQMGCCICCGKPWVRRTEREIVPLQATNNERSCDQNRRGNMPRANVRQTTLGWMQDCDCDAGVQACTVLDPFAGAGTTGLVADRLQRDAIGIELNPDYIAMSRKRLENDAGLFADIAAD